MKSKFAKFAKVAALGFAMAFTLSCSNDDSNNNGGGDGGSLSYQGKDYKTVKIGSQTWMAENLNYNVGVSVCYNGSEANCTTFGRLYNWETAKIACPSGWRLPSDADWEQLMTSLGGSEVAGTKLMSASGWDNKSDGTSGNGDNTSGFNALPGGACSSVDQCGRLGNYGGWWNADYSDKDAPYNGYCNRYMERGHANVRPYCTTDETYLFSVRCVK